jgi:presenilin 1
MNKGIENKSNTYRMSNLTGDATIKTTDNNQLSSNALTPSNQIDDSNLRVEIIDGQTRQPTSQEDIEPTGDEAEEELVLKYSAQHVIKLFIPVSICLVFVIISLSFITSYQSSGGAQL